MTTAEIIINREGPLGWVIINRPSSRNALTTPMWQQLADEINGLAQDTDIRVIIVRGAGAHSFIAGADISDLKKQLQNPNLVAESYRFTTALMESISEANKPVVAMINGHCLGGGLLIALACDLRFASDTAKFGIPAVRLGVAYPPEHGIARLVQTVGVTHASDFLLSGRIVDADEAAKIHLINRVVDSASLESFVREYSLGLAREAPLSQAAHKLAIQQSIRFQPDLAQIEAAVLHCYQSEDCQEGLAAYLSKRVPVFKGS